MKTLLTLVVFVVVLILGVVAFVYSGIYDVAATSPDGGLIGGVLNATRHHSIDRRLADIKPPALDNPEMIRRGLIHYYEMCVTCHGAPGVGMSEIGEGLNPAPPELAGKTHGDEAAEFFWIIKNGIKMTGMPSFGVTHTDEEVWAIVAFVQRMPKLSPEQYEAMVREAGLEEETAPAPDEEHHEHANEH